MNRRDVFNGIKKLVPFLLVGNKRVDKQSILFRMDRFVECLVSIKLPCLWNRYFHTKVGLQIFHHNTIGACEKT
ncbi:hypothetical protein PBCV1_a477L [Paramecium bursaria Chlorella virus 1]|uniref:Uncharacterized protein n=1 Tax=Paramecium bursaria Chlorella virus 1 TaxID=10506 RepID=Q98527_PBCV1|nr:hypothetical protein PBCV1_a477L [Paramecium bursaria Chlorella virus 1]AAC96844.1 hypothetical protein [Paramecium bursaria Chlorella virus 1]